MSHDEYKDRTQLAQFVSSGTLPTIPTFKAELNRLEVGTLAIRVDVANYATAQIALESTGFHLASRCGAYTIWTKAIGTPK